MIINDVQTQKQRVKIKYYLKKSYWKSSWIVDYDEIYAYDYEDSSQKNEWLVGYIGQICKEWDTIGDKWNGLRCLIFCKQNKNV